MSSPKIMSKQNHKNEDSILATIFQLTSFLGGGGKFNEIRGRIQTTLGPK